jgi:surfactin synthase thioesterase subunit
MKAILLHHAGGDKYAWRAYESFLAPELTPVALEIPGRGDRFGESLLTSMHDMADDIFNQVKTHTTAPYIMAGKSMGALLTYLVLCSLQDAGLRLPEQVFLGSRKCPASYPHQHPIYYKDTATFWEGVKEYGGISEALLQHAELRELFEPILRADFQALETYRHADDRIFNIPATIMYGKQDRITAEALQSWQQYFSLPIDLYAFESGHFFMYDEAEKITALMKSKTGML